MQTNTVPGYKIGDFLYSKIQVQCVWMALYEETTGRFSKNISTIPEETCIKALNMFLEKIEEVNKDFYVQIDYKNFIRLIRAHYIKMSQRRERIFIDLSFIRVTIDENNTVSVKAEQPC